MPRRLGRYRRNSRVQLREVKECQQYEGGRGGNEDHHWLQFQERCPHWGGDGKGTPAKQLNRCGHPVSFTPLNTAIKDSVTWCSNSNHLLPNTTKTMEMVVDFRSPRPHLELVVIKGDSVEVVHLVEHLGVQLDDWLDRQHRCSVQERIDLLLLFLLRRLASFIIWRKLLQIFYQR